MYLNVLEYNILTIICLCKDSLSWKTIRLLLMKLPLRGEKHLLWT